MVSVIICTYNRSQTLRETLDSLLRMVGVKTIIWELIVVDNNSSDGTRDVVEQFTRTAALDIHYVRETRPGLSYARNTGIETARGDIIIFTDDDVAIDKNWLRNLVRCFTSLDVSAIGGRVVPVWPCPKPSWFAESGPFASPKAITSCDLGGAVCLAGDSIVGANMAFRRTVFAKYGLFRTDLGRTQHTLAGGEDIEFFRRIRSRGETILFVPTATVFHPVSEERTRRSYFEQWCFHGARSHVRLEGIPAVASCFGIPRYLLREFVENACKWFFSYEPKRRFYYKLRLFSIAGMIAEIRQLRALAPCA